MSCRRGSKQSLRIVAIKIIDLPLLYKFPILTCRISYITLSVFCDFYLSCVHAGFECSIYNMAQSLRIVLLVTFTSDLPLHTSTNC